MGTSAIFPSAAARAAMYESFYLRAVSAEQPQGVWIRYTVDKRRGERASGTLWCTMFDAHRGRPFMHRVSSDALVAPAGGWIEVDGSRMTPGSADGVCGAARWSLRFASDEPELRHLPREWLYDAPLPRTKLTSPYPAAGFDGELEIPGRDTIELHGWRGMVGHNWGAGHAERWIWLHGIGFEEEPQAWLDVALGRLKVAGRMTPWLANGALSLDGQRHRIGGLTARGLQVSESDEGCLLRLPGEDGLVLDVSVTVPPGAAARWRYADPHSQSAQPGDRDVVHCSVSALELTVRPEGGGPARVLRTAHGGAYELGQSAQRGGWAGEGVPAQP
jgi:hypothetical protein